MMAHRILYSLDMWYDLGYAQELRKDYKLILVDLRGCGMSDKPHNPEAYDMKLQASDMVAVLDDLGIVKAHYLGAAGYGGRTGYLLPLYAPGRFLSVIAFGCNYPIRGRADGGMELVLHITDNMGKLLDMPRDKMLETMYSQFVKAFGGSDTPAMRERLLLTADPDAVVAMIWHFQEMSFPDATEYLPKFTMPCLMIAREGDPRSPDFTECAKLIPTAAFVSMPGASQSSLTWRTDVTIPVIKKFLAEVEKSIKK